MIIARLGSILKHEVVVGGVGWSWNTWKRGWGWDERGRIDFSIIHKTLGWMNWAVAAVTSLLCQVWPLGHTITNLLAGEGSHCCRAVSPLGAYVLHHTLSLSAWEKRVIQLLHFVFIVLGNKTKSRTEISHCYMNYLKMFHIDLCFTCTDKKVPWLASGLLAVAVWVLPGVAALMLIIH